MSEQGQQWAVSLEKEPAHSGDSDWLKVQVLDSKVVRVSTETDRTVMTHPSSIDEKQEQQS